MTAIPEIRPGDVLALDASNPISHWPEVSHALYRVSRVTATQAVAIGKYGYEIRVRLSDLKVVGEQYKRAAIAGDDLQAKHAAQVAEVARYGAAAALVADLIDLPMHRLKLSTKQLEALARAWVEIKAMKA